MRYIISFLILIVSLPILAQSSYSTKNKKAIKFYEEANVYIRQRNFTKGINTLYLAIEKDQEFIEAHNRLAFCFDVLKDRERQQFHLKEVVRLDRTHKYPNTKYLLANVYYNQGDYDNAHELLAQFLNNSTIDSKIRKDADELKINIDYAIEHIKKPVEFDPKQMPPQVNALPLQYFPVLTADQKTIFFTGYAPPPKKQPKTSSIKPDLSRSPIFYRVRTPPRSPGYR